jgi:hypothetical protein
MALQALRETCGRHPRLAAFAGLAAMLTGAEEKALVRIDVIPVSEEAVARYNARHQAALPWPPPVLEASVTARLDRTPKTTSKRTRNKGGAHARA